MTQRNKTSQPTLTSHIKPLSGNKDAQATLKRMVEPALKKVSEFKTTKERLHYVADMIEAEALVKKNIGFNMNWYREDFRDPEMRQDADKLGHSCGTVACIAGWATLLERGADYGRTTHENQDFHQKAMEILGISKNEADELFTPGDMGTVDYDEVTAERAVAVIRDFADNGEVRWGWFGDKGEKLDAPRSDFTLPDWP